MDVKAKRSHRRKRRPEKSGKKDITPYMGRMGRLEPHRGRRYQARQKERGEWERTIQEKRQLNLKPEDER